MYDLYMLTDKYVNDRYQEIIDRAERRRYERAFYPQPNRMPRALRPVIIALMAIARR